MKAGRRILSVKAPKGLSGAKMLLDEASVTATENILMAAVLARGETEIYNETAHLACTQKWLDCAGEGVL